MGHVFVVASCSTAGIAPNRYAPCTFRLEFHWFGSHIADFGPFVLRWQIPTGIWTLRRPNPPRCSGDDAPEVAKDRASDPFGQRRTELNGHHIQAEWEMGQPHHA